jgi:hypothetical protein
MCLSVMLTIDYSSSLHWRRLFNNILLLKGCGMEADTPLKHLQQGFVAE